ncbi:hypothetical protein [Serratia proteamaculans]
MDKKRFAHPEKADGMKNPNADYLKQITLFAIGIATEIELQF